MPSALRIKELRDLNDNVALVMDASGNVAFHGTKMKLPTGTSDPSTGLAGEVYFNTEKCTPPTAN